MLFCTFLCRSFTFCEGREHKTTTFFLPSFPELWYSLLEFNSRKIANIWRVEQDGISEIQFEAARLHFLSDVVVAPSTSLSSLINAQWQATYLMSILLCIFSFAFGRIQTPCQWNVHKIVTDTVLTVWRLWFNSILLNKNLRHPKRCSSDLAETFNKRQLPGNRSKHQPTQCWTFNWRKSRHQAPSQGDHRQ